MGIHIQKRKKGFTLAELLAVVAIVAILAAISIPIFGTDCVLQWADWKRNRRLFCAKDYHWYRRYGRHGCQPPDLRVVGVLFDHFDFGITTGGTPFPKTD